METLHDECEVLYAKVIAYEKKIALLKGEQERLTEEIFNNEQWKMQVEIKLNELTNKLKLGL